MLSDYARVLEVNVNVNVNVNVLLGAAPPSKLPKWKSSPQRRRHLEQLRTLAKRDRLAVARIVHELAKIRNGREA